MEIPAAIEHTQPADLDGQPGELRKLADGGAPDLEHFVALAVVRRDAEQPADVVEHDIRLGVGAHEIRYIAELRMEEPRLE
ncbi:hypothetical protein D3C83_86620 [compost metagenome]